VPAAAVAPALDIVPAVAIAPAAAIEPALGIDDEPLMPAVAGDPVPAFGIPAVAVFTADPDVPALSAVFGIILIELPAVGCIPSPGDSVPSSPPQAAASATHDTKTKRANFDGRSRLNMVTSHARERQFL
jgi:hypothetical protein